MHPYHRAVTSRDKDSLSKIEVQVAKDLEKQRHRRVSKKQNGEFTKNKVGGNTRIAKDVKEHRRYPPPVPKNKSLEEILEMDPHSPEFRLPHGRPQKWDYDQPNDELSWRDMVRRDFQKRASDRRARARKHEAVMVKAQEIVNDPNRERKKVGSRSPDAGIKVYDEERIIAEGIVSLDDWDDEELVRGYRRNRNGKFGTPPKYIPREVQQEAFRRLVQRGERKMRDAYMRVLDELIELAHNASSEKVRLEAQKELMNRVVGKIPDRMMVTHDQPWEGILADSLVPISELPPIEMEVGDDGVARTDPGVE